MFVCFSLLTALLAFLLYQPFGIGGRESRSHRLVMRSRGWPGFRHSTCLGAHNRTHTRNAQCLHGSTNLFHTLLRLGGATCDHRPLRNRRRSQVTEARCLNVTSPNALKSRASFVRLEREHEAVRHNRCNWVDCDGTQCRRSAAFWCAFWASFAIVTGSILVNGLIATIEDDLLVVSTIRG